jgi:hypothetical protein
MHGKLEGNSKKIWSLHNMEETVGEPDVVGFDGKTGMYIFFDFLIESPKDCHSVCYESEALASRKKSQKQGCWQGS